MRDKELNIVLDDITGLYDLLKSYRYSIFPQKGTINLNIKKLSKVEKKYWQRKLEKYYFACGCKEGSATSIIFFALYWVFTIYIQSINAILKWEVWIISIIFLFAGAFFGKIAGLLYSKFVFKITIKRLILLIF